MFVRFARSTVVPLWLAVFGLAALLWSPMTVAMGALLLVAALAGSAAILVWQAR